MNLNYPIQEVAVCMNAKIIGNSNGIIKQVSIDSRSPLINSETLFIALKGQRSHGQQFIKEFISKGGSIVVVEEEIPNISCDQLIVEDSIKALHALAEFHRKKFNIPVIAITGSNGKTTVKEWLYHVLKSQFSVVRSPKSYNSQIGVPLSILEISSQHQIAIIEAGISQTGEMEMLERIIKPTIGVFTGIGSAHSLGFSSDSEKEQEKFLLFKDLKTVFSPKNIDDINSNEIPFNDKVALLNAGLVKAVAEFLGLNKRAMSIGLSTLPSISMRMERMEGVDGNILINDTYTFDEKGLEIALKAIEVNQVQSSKVLVLAPDHNYRPSQDLKNIISASKIDTVVWIFPTSISLRSGVKVIHIHSVDSFIKSPISFSNSVILFSGSRSMQLERCIPLYQLKKHITQLEIHLDSVRRNLNYYKQLLNKGTQVLAMVKAQSYGSGSIEMAKFLESEKVNALGVAYADEGVALINEGVKLPILVMNPEQAAFDDIIDYHLEPSIYSMRILDKFLNQLILKGKTRVPVHIKLDTGMNRLGFVSDEVSELIDTLNAQPEVYVKGVFSHLAAAGDADQVEFTNQQITIFEELCAKIETGIGYNFTRHLSNTEGIANFPSAHFEMVRLGIGLFGLGSQNASELEQALSFRTHISQIKLVPAGQSVGYGRAFVAKRETVVGIIPVGYADGLSRQLINGGWHLKINDSFAPIIGLVCMDMCMVDLTDINCSEGDAVEVFGWKDSILDMAKELKTIPYEIISSISSRVQRVYID